jgi:hypothetical protein
VTGYPVIAGLAMLLPVGGLAGQSFVASTPTLYEGLVSHDVNLGSAMTVFRWEGDVTRTSDGAPFYVENQDVVAGNTTSAFIRLQQQGDP